jgi:hypothetical protein
MRPFSWRLTLRIIAVLSWVVAIAWLIVEPGFEPLLALLGGVTAFVASSAVGGWSHQQSTGIQIDS